MGFDHWVFGPSFPSFLSPYHLSLRYVLSLKTTLRPWHHTLCLIALMWAIFGIDSGAFCLWWTRSYGMTLHWGIAISESFSIGWPLCRGILFSVDDGFFRAMSIPWRISDVLFHIGAWDMIGVFHMVYFTQEHTPFGPWWFLGIVVLSRRLDSFHIGVRDMIGWFPWCDHRSIAFSSWLTYFLRWLDHGTGTYESMQRSLVISGFALYWGITLSCESMQRSLVILGFALYWGITLSLVVDLRDTSSHWDMFF